MKITVSETSGKPIYEQIKQQIRAAVLNGDLLPGDPLPSLRKLAGELGISILTITRAYNELAEDGILVNMQGKGTFVADRSADRMREQLTARVGATLDAVCVAAKTAGIPLIDLLSMLEDRYNSTPGPDSK